jgi:hypothetical protein
LFSSQPCRRYKSSFYNSIAQKGLFVYRQSNFFRLSHAFLKVAYTAFEGKTPHRKEFFMQLDRKKLDRLLGMSDEQLGALVQSIAKESGIDPAMLGLNPDNIQSIRHALGSATDEDLKELDQICNTYRQQKKNR